MRCTAGLVTAVCALGASAFVLPTGFEPELTEFVSPLDSDPKSQVLFLSCSDCAFSNYPLTEDERMELVGSDEEFSTTGGAYAIMLNYTVSDDNQRFEMDGQVLWPLELAGSGPSAHVKQVPYGVSISDVEAGLTSAVPLEVTAAYWSIPDISDFDASVNSLIELDHHVLELNEQIVSLPPVKITLLKTEDELAIVDIYPDPSFERQKGAHDDAFEDLFIPSLRPEKDAMPEPVVDDHPPKCRMPSALCKLQSLIESKIAAFRQGGCHGARPANRLPTHIRPHFDEDGRPRLPRPHPPPPHPHDGPDAPPHHGPDAHPPHPPHPHPHDGPEGPHDGPHGPPHRRPHHRRPHHHRHRHSIFHAFARSVAAIVIPTLAGVAGGMLTFLVGLAIGRLIGYLWITLVRGGRQGNASVALDDSCVPAELDVEKVYLISEMEAPPVYEDVAESSEDVKAEKH